MNVLELVLTTLQDLIVESNVQEFGELVFQSLVACNWPWWEHLHHENWQTLQIRAYFFFLIWLTNTPLDITSGGGGEIFQN